MNQVNDTTAAEFEDGEQEAKPKTRPPDIVRWIAAFENLALGAHACKVLV